MDSRVDKAMMAVDRQNFLPAGVREYAQQDRPLPIGYGQTNSQPTTVRRMLEWLEVEEGMNVLDVGSGSGWTSALLAYLVGDSGRVVAVERINALVDMGRKNCERTGLQGVSFYQAGEECGWPEEAPFDRILVSASASSLPDALLNQLASSGKLVIPIGNIIYEITKHNDGRIERRSHPGYAFVPLL